MLRIYPPHLLSLSNILSLMQVVMENPGWHRKLKDENYLAQLKKQSEKYGLDNEVFYYAFHKLTRLALPRRRWSVIDPTGVDCVRVLFPSFRLDNTSPAI